MPQAHSQQADLSWRESLELMLKPEVLAMLFLGFSAGVPLLLIFSSLSLWLGEAGIERSAITFFSWAALGYSFKFIWAPLVDKLPIPVLSKRLGRRRSWMLLAQMLIIAAIVGMGSIDPAHGDDALHWMAIFAVLLGFSAATQDIVIDAFRIEAAALRVQAMLSASYVAGYRLGMIVSGAGALFLASYLGSEKGAYRYDAWQWTYYLMAATMLVGVITTLVIPEPKTSQKVTYPYSVLEYFRLLVLFVIAVCIFAATFRFLGGLFSDSKSELGILGAFFVEFARFILSLAISILSSIGLIRAGVIDRSIARETWVDPFQDFFQRYGLKHALLLLALVGLYRISDIIPGVISNLFYQEMGFSKNEIAAAVKTFGVVVSVLGGFVGGILASHYGVMRMLMWGAILASSTNLVFTILAMKGYSLPMLYAAVTIDNLAAGFASAVFIAFLSSLTSIRFTAVQYAIFSSLMTLLPKLLAGYSGMIVDAIDYANFFILCAMVGLPVLALVYLASIYLHDDSN